jgi:hypothetical protein
LQNSDFQNHFSMLKINGIFLQVMMFKILHFLKMGHIFSGSLNNFDRSDGDVTISTKAELPKVGIFFALNFIPWDFSLIKMLEIKKAKTT